MRGRLSGSRLLPARNAMAARMQSEHAPGSAQNKALQDCLEQQGSSSRTQGHAHGDLALAPDRPHQHQSGKIHAGNQQDHRDGKETECAAAGALCSIVSSCCGRTTALICRFAIIGWIVPHDFLCHPLRIRSAPVVAVRPGLSLPTIW